MWSCPGRCCGEGVGSSCWGIDSAHSSVSGFPLRCGAGGICDGSVGDGVGSRCCGSGVAHSSIAFSSFALTSFARVCFVGVL